MDSVDFFDVSVSLFICFTHTPAQGMRWQVPWGKHTPAHYKESHATDKAKEIAKDDILPVVTIRNPYRWMASMCRNPYTARWSHRPDHCPQLQTANGDWNRVSVKYGAGKESYLSLAHLYNDWYHGYTQNASYPWIMIRMEGMWWCLRSFVLS